jgi:site-specific recombinase XerD
MTLLPFPTARAGVSLSPRPTAELADLIANFLLDLMVVGRQPRTIGEHTKELRRYGRWLDEAQLRWDLTSEDDLAAYLRTRAHLGPSARAATTCSMRVFHDWLVRRHHRKTSPAAGLATPMRPKPTPKVLTKAQLRLLVDYLKEQEGMRARRDEVVITMALYTGMRAAELAAIRWEDMDLDAAVLIIGLSKGNHGRALALHVDLVALLRQWRTIQEPKSRYVFASTQDGNKVSPARIGKIVGQAAKATGLELHAHKLRHSFATWLLRESKDLFAVSKALGHKELKQTQIYIPAAVDVDQLAEAVAFLPGPGDW